MWWMLLNDEGIPRKAKANVREGNHAATNNEEGVPKFKARFFALKSMSNNEWSLYVPFRYVLVYIFMKIFIIYYD